MWRLRFFLNPTPKKSPQKSPLALFCFRVCRMSQRIGRKIVANHFCRFQKVQCLSMNFAVFEVFPIFVSNMFFDVQERAKRGPRETQMGPSWASVGLSWASQNMFETKTYEIRDARCEMRAAGIMGWFHMGTTRHSSQMAGFHEGPRYIRHR